MKALQIHLNSFLIIFKFKVLWEWHYRRRTKRGNLMPFINEMAGCRDAQSYQYQRSDPCQFRTRCRCSDLEITELILHRYNALRGVAGGQRATEISTLIIYVRVSTVSARVCICIDSGRGRKGQSFSRYPFVDMHEEKVLLLGTKFR